MNETPRTEAQIKKEQVEMWSNPVALSCAKVSADFARELERELNEAKRHLPEPPKT